MEERNNDEAGETWQKLSGHSIIAGKELLENVGNKNGIGSTWMLQCQNESCPSQERNLAFSTTEKSRVFEINRASVANVGVM